jgi:hypothetical protein
MEQSTKSYVWNNPFFGWKTVQRRDILSLGGSGPAVRASRRENKSGSERSGARISMTVVIDRQDYGHSRRCQCKAATLRAYEELRARGESIRVAMEAASVVYRYHHPEFSAQGAIQSIAGWLLNRAEPGSC